MHQLLPPCTDKVHLRLLVLGLNDDICHFMKRLRLALSANPLVPKHPLQGIPDRGVAIPGACGVVDIGTLDCIYQLCLGRGFPQGFHWNLFEESPARCWIDVLPPFKREDTCRAVYVEKITFCLVVLADEESSMSRTLKVDWITLEDGNV